jgi:Zn-dependent protease
LFRLPDLNVLIPLFVILILSLSVHEAAHAWTANWLGDPTARLLGRLTLNPLAHIDWIGTVLFPLIAMLSGLPLLGWAKPVPVNMSQLGAPRRDFALVAIAGPISNLLIAIAAALVLGAWTSATDGFVGDSRATALLVLAVRLNVLLAVFNLLPIPPLDGGNVLAGFVPESFARLIDQIRPYGFLILYALLFTGTLWTLVGPIQNVVLQWLL